MKSLPSGPWEVLLQRALWLVEDIQRHGGARIRYGHSEAEPFSCSRTDVASANAGVPLDHVS